MQAVYCENIIPSCLQSVLLLPLRAGDGQAGLLGSHLLRSLLLLSEPLQGRGSPGPSPLLRWLRQKIFKYSSNVISNFSSNFWGLLTKNYFCTNDFWGSHCYLVLMKVKYFSMHFLKKYAWNFKDTYRHLYALTSRREYLEFPLDILSWRCWSSRTLEVRMFSALCSRLLQDELVAHTSGLGQLRHLVWITSGEFSYKFDNGNGEVSLMRYWYVK